MRLAIEGLRRLIRLSAVVGVLGFAAAAAITLYNVIGRPFGFGLLGAVDLVQLFVLGGGWLVIPYAFMTGAHVGVKAVINTLPTALQWGLRTAAILAAMALLALMLLNSIESFQQELRFGDVSQEMGIPIMYYWLPVLYGMGLSVLAAPLVLLGDQDRDRD